MRSRWVLRNGIKVWQATVDKCGCMGYHFPHRKGSGACIEGQYADYHHAKRAGLDESECQALLSANQLERKFPL